MSAADVVDLEVARETVLGSVAHDLETYLTALGIIALIMPLLGILGTVVGMIDVLPLLYLHLAIPLFLQVGFPQP